jgi:hypothetical protein
MGENLRRLFTDHPRSVGKTYFEHMRMAFGFGATKVAGGLACILHGILPACCVSTGSKVIASPPDQMVSSRRKASIEAPAREI